jgi:flagellar biosynthesis/type III secretory pathway chaperone
MSSTNESQQELLVAIEGAMVTEFRLCQSLFTLTKDERKALIEGNASVLSQIADKKELILDELGKIEQYRRMVTDRLTLSAGFGSEIKDLSDLLSRVRIKGSERISRLQQGILALQAEIREINMGNSALANINLERLNSLQSYLVNLIATPNHYYPNAAAPAVEPPATWGMDHRA